MHTMTTTTGAAPPGAIARGADVGGTTRRNVARAGKVSTFTTTPPVTACARRDRRVAGAVHRASASSGAEGGERESLASGAASSRGRDDDLVARLRLGESGGGESAASRGAVRREMRERDAVTRSVLAVALGVAAMMPTITAEAPTPHPVTVGAKRTIVAGAVKNVATDARGKVDKAEEAFFRDVERYVGTISV